MCSVVSMLLAGGLALPSNKPPGLTLKIGPETTEAVGGGDLASIHSAAENDEALALIGTNPMVLVCTDTDNGALDTESNACKKYYGEYEQYCGYYDDDDFSAYVMCCACGGGGGPVVHGDPMFKINGKGTHFWLKAGESTPLLTSGAITLSGRTFDRPDTGNQWFDQFTISNNGKAVLDVAMSNGQAVVKLDGKVVQTGKLNANGVEVEFGKKGERLLAVKAGALAVDIYPSAAEKFSSDKDKDKYEHLNIDFQGGIPKDSKGVFAEFAGVQAMSEATNALLKKPQAL